MKRELHIGDIQHLFLDSKKSPRYEFSPGTVYSIDLDDGKEDAIVYARERKEGDFCDNCPLDRKGPPGFCKHVACCDVRFDAVEISEVDDTTLVFSDGTPVVGSPLGQPAKPIETPKPEPKKKKKPTVALFPKDQTAPIWTDEKEAIDEIAEYLLACETLHDVDTALVDWGVLRQGDEDKELREIANAAAEKMRDYLRKKARKAEKVGDRTEGEIKSGPAPTETLEAEADAKEEERRRQTLARLEASDAADVQIREAFDEFRDAVEGKPSPEERRKYDRRTRWERDLGELKDAATKAEKRQELAKTLAKDAGAVARKAREKIDELLDLDPELYTGDTPLFDFLEEDEVGERYSYFNTMVKILLTKD